jgi:hypothetical protein
MLQPERMETVTRKSGTMNDQTTEPSDFRTLYRRAFAVYGTQALWNKRMLDAPLPEDALVVARALRIEGDREARRLAEQIEQACRASF